MGKFLDWLFGKKREEKFMTIEKKMNYNPELDIILNNDYGWKELEMTHRKVMLVNPAECQEKVTIYGLISAWRGTGHAEWEALLVMCFFDAVTSACEKGEAEADITCLFNGDFYASGGRIFTSKDVFNHLIVWFDIVEERKDILKLRFRIVD